MSQAQQPAGAQVGKLINLMYVPLSGLHDDLLSILILCTDLWA
jgi:hypothetical protein